jgi:hypothetical protein
VLSSSPSPAPGPTGITVPVAQPSGLAAAAPGEVDVVVVGGDVDVVAPLLLELLELLLEPLDELFGVVAGTGFVHGWVFVVFCPALHTGGFLHGRAAVVFCPVLQYGTVVAAPAPAPIAHVTAPRARASDTGAIHLKRVFTEAIPSLARDPAFR